jgi:uncharacterized protein (UPF0261 family)
MQSHEDTARNRSSTLVHGGSRAQRIFSDLLYAWLRVVTARSLVAAVICGHGSCCGDTVAPGIRMLGLIVSHLVTLF